MPISVVINTKNAEKYLKKCLESVKFADEIIIADMNSSDQTQKIARQYTKKIFQCPDYQYVEPARNFAISKAKYEWILIIDSDEEITLELKKKIIDIINNPNSPDIYLIARKNIIFNQWIKNSNWWPDYQIRLFKKGKVKWQDQIHSLPQAQGQQEKIEAIEDLAIIHYNYQTIFQFIERLNRYTNIEAEQNLAKSQKENFFPADFHQSFFNEWFSRYFEFQGYFDQNHGIALAYLQAFYNFTVKLKAWEKSDFHDQNYLFLSFQEIRNISQILNYWLADYYVNNTSGIIKLYWRFRRKFKV